LNFKFERPVGHLEYGPEGHKAIKAQGHNLIRNFRILLNLISNDSTHRAKEISANIDKGQKFFIIQK